MAGNPLARNHRVVLATRKPGALIQIGDDCGFTSTSFGVSLVAAERIVIGDRVQVGANSTIVDTVLSLPLLMGSEFSPAHRRGAGA